MTNPEIEEKSLSWLDRLSDALLREPKDREQLVALLRDAEERHLINSDALSMIEGALQVSDMQARDIMIPRSQVIVIEENQTLNDIMPIVTESAHSRIPVMDESRDKVIGILHAKDLLKTTQDDKDFLLSKIIKPAIIIPESKRLDVLLREFRKNRKHMAIVVDEFGLVSGLVTIEDVLEQIVGDIEDEFDVEEEHFIQQHSDNDFMVKALTPIEDFNEYFKCALPDDKFDTIGGLVTHALGHLPEPGAHITLENFDFEVIRADKRQIHLLRLITDKQLESQTSA